MKAQTPRSRSTRALSQLANVADGGPDHLDRLHYRLVKLARVFKDEPAALRVITLLAQMYTDDYRGRPQ